MANVSELCFTVHIENVEKPFPPKHFGLVPGALVKVGRAKGNDLVLDQRGISSLHMEFRVKQEAGTKDGCLSLVVRDVSMNGTALKRDGDANVIALEKNIDTTLPDGGMLLIPLRLKDVTTGERACLRVQYEESTSAPAQVANGTPAPAAPGQQCEADPYGDAPDESDLVTALDAYLDCPKASETRHGSAAKRLLSRVETSAEKAPSQPVQGFARKAGASLPPARHDGAKRVPKSLPAPATGSTASVPSPPPPARSRDANGSNGANSLLAVLSAPVASTSKHSEGSSWKAVLPSAPPKASSKARSKATLPSPPEKTSEPAEESRRGSSPEHGRRRRRERRRRSESHQRASSPVVERTSPPRHESSRRRRQISRSRSPKIKNDWQQMPAPPPPPPSRDRQNQDRSSPAAGRRDPLPWESNPPPSTWDGPASGSRRNDDLDWSSGRRQAGQRTWLDNQKEANAGSRRQWEAPEWQRNERERSDSRGARKRYRR